jgi:hypothetical protein
MENQKSSENFEQLKKIEGKILTFLQDLNEVVYKLPKFDEKETTIQDSCNKIATNLEEIQDNLHQVVKEFNRSEAFTRKDDFLYENDNITIANSLLAQFKNKFEKIISE